MRGVVTANGGPYRTNPKDTNAKGAPKLNLAELISLLTPMADKDGLLEIEAGSARDFERDCQMRPEPASAANEWAPDWRGGDLKNTDS